MISENKFLTKAIQKAGYIVMVKHYKKSDMSSVLEYISPNASEIGMNAELLKKGLKLSVDYIHPEDRNIVFKTFTDVADTGINDYVHDYRMVGDDGNIYNITNEICITDMNNEAFTVECYMRNADTIKSIPKKKKEKREEKSQYEKTNPAEYAGDFSIEKNNRVFGGLNAFASIAKLYSAIVDNEGSIVFPPVGPMENIGDFYDLFEKPAYKEYYKKIKEEVLENNMPQIFDREEGGIGKLSLAPLKTGDNIMGFWIMGSYTEEETKQLNDIYETQWEVAELISESIHYREKATNEVAKSRGTGKKLREELDRQNIIASILSKSLDEKIENADGIIEEILMEVSQNLGVDKSFLYIIKSSYHTHNRVKCYWDVAGGDPDNTILFDLPEHIPRIKKVINQNGYYIADEANITERAKLALLRHGFKAFVIVPMYRGKEIYGLMFFADCDTSRVWSSEELRFMDSATLIISRMIDNMEGKDNVRKVNKHLIESYNSFKVGIFIRDAFSGEVLFANDVMNKMVGCDFKGKDSREIITDLHDRFDNIDAMRKPFITKNKTTNWRKYIEALGGIMDISETQIYWLNGEPASLIIIRPVKEN